MMTIVPPSDHLRARHPFRKKSLENRGERVEVAVYIADRDDPRIGRRHRNRENKEEN